LFEGAIRKVDFERDFGGKCGDPKGMTEIDFTQATFDDVRFSGFDLDDVAWPAGDDYIVLDNWHIALVTAAAALELKGEEWRWVFSSLRRMAWNAGPSQKRGLLNLRDFSVGPEAVAWLRQRFGRGLRLA